VFGSAWWVVGRRPSRLGGGEGHCTIVAGKTKRFPHARPKIRARARRSSGAAFSPNITREIRHNRRCSPPVRGIGRDISSKVGGGGSGPEGHAGHSSALLQAGFHARCRQWEAWGKTVAKPKWRAVSPRFAPFVNHAATDKNWHSAVVRRTLPCCRATTGLGPTATVLHRQYDSPLRQSLRRVKQNAHQSRAGGLTHKAHETTRRAYQAGGLLEWRFCLKRRQGHRSRFGVDVDRISFRQRILYTA